MDREHGKEDGGPSSPAGYYWVDCEKLAKGPGAEAARIEWYAAIRAKQEEERAALPKVEPPTRETGERADDLLFARRANPGDHVAETWERDVEEMDQEDWESYLGSRKTPKRRPPEERK